MDNAEKDRIPKTKEEKCASKQLKKLEKEKRKEKSLNKIDTSNSPLLKNCDEAVINKNVKTLNENVKTDLKIPNSRAEINKSDQSSTSNNQKYPNKRNDDVHCKSDDSKTKKMTKQNVIAAPIVQQKHKFFDHIFQSDRQIIVERTLCKQNIHSEFIKFASEMVNGKAQGSTRRCQLFLNATKQMVIDFPSNGEQVLSGVFGQMFERQIEFISQYRPLAVTMRTAINYLRSNSSIVTENDNEKCKNSIIEMIDIFLKERIDTAQETITATASKYLNSNTNVLVYSYSQLIFKSILYSWNQLGMEHKEKFQVYVVDIFPPERSESMTEQLALHGIAYIRVAMSSVPAIMNKIDIVIFGAHSILTNNNIISRSGTASIANIAKIHRKPVMVCAESLKFHVPSQTDAFEYNELGSSDRLIEAMTVGHGDLAEKLKKSRLITAVDLLYDIVPHKHVTMICCELGTISPTTASYVTVMMEPVGV